MEQHRSDQVRLSLLAQIGLLMGPFLSMMDSNIVNVAVPDIASALHSNLAAIQWVVSAYLLAASGALAGSSYFAKRFGTIGVYVTSIVGFTVGSALCGVAHTVGFLIFARILQGIMGAPLIPLAMGMLMGGKSRRVPPIMGMLLFLAPAIGPTVGGTLLHFTGWPSIFFINVPVGIIGTIASLRIPKDTSLQGSRSVRLDLFGLLTLAGGLTFVVYGASNGPLSGWSSTKSCPFLLGGGVLLFIYVMWSLRAKNSILDIKIFGQWHSALSIALCTLTSIIVFSMVVLVPIFMETIQRYTPLIAGISLPPQALVTGIGTGISDKISKRFGIKGSAVAGMALLTLGTVLMLWIQVDTPAWVTSLLMVVRGLAIGLVIQQLLQVLLVGLSPYQMADASTIFNVAQRIGGAIGIALLTTYFQARETFHFQRLLTVAGIRNMTSNTAQITSIPQEVKKQLMSVATAGFHDTLWILVVLSAGGLLLALLLKDSRTATAHPQSSKSV